MSSSFVKLNLAKYKLISFDVTGTLFRLRHSPGTFYERVAREEFGYKGLDVKSLDHNFRTNFKALTKEYPNYGHNWRQWWTTLVQRTFKDSEVINPIHLEILSEKLIDLFETEECWMATEKAVEIVRHVKGLGKCTAIITNSDPRTGTILRNLRFPEFNFILSAFEGTMKPDAKIFQLALERSGCPGIKPQEAMHIGNDPILDYEAANNCSWTGVLINKDVVENDDPEGMKFKSLANFMDHLQKI